MVLRKIVKFTAEGNEPHLVCFERLFRIGLREGLKEKS